RLRSAVGEGDDRSERRAASPIGSARGRCDAVAHAIQAGNWLVGAVEHTAVAVGLRATLGVQRAGYHERRVVRAARTERPHRRVRAAGLFLDVAVEQLLDDALAAVEVQVLAGLRETVEAGDAGLQVRQELGRRPRATGHAGVLGHALVDGARQFGQRRALDDVAVVGALGHDEPSIFGARRMILRALVPDRDAHEIR